MREISAIAADLTNAANDIKVCKNALNEATKKVNDASAQHDGALQNAAKLRTELDEALNALVPSSQQSRVRTS